MTKFLMFSIIETRLNIIFFTAVVSYFLKNLLFQYIKVVKIILKYLKGSKQQKIINRSKKELKSKEILN